MFTLFKKLFYFFKKVWKKIPDEVQDEIINIIVDTFEKVIRDYYYKHKSRI